MAEKLKESRSKYLESSKERKRRLWREREQQRRGHTRRAAAFTGWMFLPDLVLEQIFTFLSYKVGS